VVRVAHVLLALLVLVAPLRVARTTCQCPPTCAHHGTKRLPCHGPAKGSPCHHAPSGPAWAPLGCGHATDVGGVRTEPALLAHPAALAGLAFVGAPPDEAPSLVAERHLRPPIRPPRSRPVVA